MQTRKLISLLSISLLALAGCGGGGSNSATGAAAGVGTTGKPLVTITFATAASGPTALFENIYIADKLGYYADEGLKVEFVNTGGNAAVTSLVAQGKAQTAVGVPNFQVLYRAQGKPLPGIDYYEYTYPSKWSLVTKNGSTITSVADLKGKRIGITSRGTADEQVLDTLLRQGGVDPKAVTMVVVGATTAGGLALTKGTIDANLVWDTTLGQYDVAGISYKALIGPKDMTKVGGFFIQATPAYIKDHHDQAVGFARAVAKATVFALANPEAAASIYLDIYPVAASADSRAKQISNTVTTVKYRAERWTPYQDPAKFGYIQPSEFQNEIVFANVAKQISDPSQFYTNALIDEINNFDKAAVTAQAKAYKAK